MKRIYFGLLLSLSLLLLLSACSELFESCEHVWREADCTAPRTCTVCGKTDGDIKAHSYQAATCTKPQTCSACGFSQGTELGHDFEAATCAKAKTCTRCGETEGEPLAHDWAEATCTDAKTCRTCKITEGEALAHDWAEATCKVAKKCNLCKKSEGKPIDHDYVKNVCTMCGEKLIDSYSKLCRYLRDNYGTLETPLGTIKGITFDVEDHDPPLYICYDYDLRIETELELSGTDVNVLSALGSDYYSYEDRLATMICLIEYLHDVGQVAIDAFPDKRVRGCFFKEGYEYPAIKVGYYNFEYMTFVNYEGSDYGSYNADAKTTVWHIEEYKGDNMNRYFPVPDKLKQEAATKCDYPISFLKGE